MFALPTCFAFVSAMASVSAFGIAATPEDNGIEPLQVVVTVCVINVDSDGRKTRQVIGADVYNHTTNERLGTTGRDGTVIVRVPNGTSIRVVESNYGLTQAFHIVHGSPGENGGTDHLADTVNCAWPLRN